MSTLAPNSLMPSPAPLASPAVYRITVDEYEAMAEAGILRDSRIELLDGLLVKKMPQKPPHVWTVESIDKSLTRLLPPGWFTRQEKPVRIPDFDEPEPDVSVVKGTRDDYLEGHPEPPNLALLVEVSDSSLDRDRGEKRFAYAKGRVACYWIVNLVDRQVEVYTDPAATGYQSSQVFQAGDEVPIMIDGAEVGRIPVADLLPPRR
jgi:Uma2 family endonuclease